MIRTLPPRPSLEQLKKQAKDLRKGHQSASTEAAERIKANLPKFSAASADEILHGECSLQEAQHGIASEYGCKHWDMLYAVVAAALNVLAGLCDEHIQDVLREMDFGQVTDLMPDLGLLARTEGIDGFAALPAALED